MNDRVDPLTASAVSAREQISLAVADKIRQMESGKELRRVAHEVLPAFEKFLRSPEEKRLRRVRAGVITTGIGLAASIAALLGSLAQEDFLPMLIPTFIVLMIGLTVLINGLWFTVSKKSKDDPNVSIPPTLSGFTQNTYGPQQLNAQTNSLRTPSPSVTEHTTHHLKSKQ